jgi:hypothetical protein
VPEMRICALREKTRPLARAKKGGSLWLSPVLRQQSRADGRAMAAEAR